MSAAEIHAALIKLHEECLDLHFGTANDTLPIMYHYTTSEAAFSIIDSQKLRLTDIRFVNDPLEISNAVSIGHKVVKIELENLEKNTLAYRAILIIWHYFLSAVQQYIDRKIIIEFEDNLVELNSALRTRIIEGVRTLEPRVFIAAFSSFGDDLTQWRAYADQGKGYNIGFDFRNSPFLEKAQHLYGINREFCGIVKTNYASDEKKSQYFSDWLKKLILFFNSCSQTAFFSSETILEADAYLVSSLMECLLYDVIACKNHHYKSENEWRIFQVDLCDKNTPSEDGFYLKNDTFIPYKVLNLTNEINKVMTGPANLNPLNHSGVEYLLKNKNIQNYLIEASGIKYRS